MLRALYTAASGMLAQQLNLDNIANNLSNSSTTGFGFKAGSHEHSAEFNSIIMYRYPFWRQMLGTMSLTNAP